MTTLTHNADVLGSALALLPSQFSASPNLRALIGAFVGNAAGAQIQGVEDVLHNLLLTRWLSDATGTQLDEIGAIVGCPRLYASDETYRDALYLQVAINTSQGDSERLIDITSRVTGASFIHYIQKQPAVALLYAHLLTKWELASKVQLATTGGVKTIVEGCTDGNPFVFSADKDGSGVPHGDDLPYGEGFGEPYTTIYRNDFTTDLTGLTSSTPNAGQAISVGSGKLNFSIDALVYADWAGTRPPDRDAPMVYRALGSLPSGATKHRLETEVKSITTTIEYAYAGIALFLDDNDWWHYHIRKNIDNTWGDEYVTYVTGRQTGVSGSNPVDYGGTTIGAAVGSVLLRIEYTPSTNALVFKFSLDSGASWTEDWSGTSTITPTQLAAFLKTAASNRPAATASFEYLEHGTETTECDGGGSLTEIYS